MSPLPTVWPWIAPLTLSGSAAAQWRKGLLRNCQLTQFTPCVGSSFLSLTLLRICWLQVSPNFISFICRIRNSWHRETTATSVTRFGHFCSWRHNFLQKWPKRLETFIYILKMSIFKLWLLLKFLVTKVAQIFGDFWGNFEKCRFSVKNYCGHF